MTKRTFEIYRYDPDTDAKPYMQTIEVELDGTERMLLDALMKLKEVDPSISRVISLTPTGAGAAHPREAAARAPPRTRKSRRFISQVLNL